jgi:hypothetical protein
MPTWLDWPILALTFVGMLVVLGMLLKTAREAQRDDRPARSDERKAGPGGFTRPIPRNETSGDGVLKPDRHDPSLRLLGVEKQKPPRRPLPGRRGGDPTDAV